MGWSDTINVADEYFHEKSDDPYWSENTLLGFTVPERNLCGFIYYYFRPNMNLVVAGPAIWDHTGEDVYNCLYYGWDQPITAENWRKLDSAIRERADDRAWAHSLLDRANIRRTGTELARLPGLCREILRCICSQ